MEMIVRFCASGRRRETMPIFLRLWICGGRKGGDEGEGGEEGG